MTGTLWSSSLGLCFEVTALPQAKKTQLPRIWDVGSVLVVMSAELA